MQRIGLARAEALASPFASIDSLRACCTTPSRCTSKPHLAQRFIKLAIRDDAGLRLRRVVEPEEFVETFLRRHSRALFEADGESVSLKPDHLQPGAEILCWRWLSLALPAELLLAAAGLGNASKVRVLDRSIRVLEPTAHLHFHATAAIPFTEIWENFGRSADFRRIKEAPRGFTDHLEWIHWLCRTFVAQRVLRVWMNCGIAAVDELCIRWPEIRAALRDLMRGSIATQTNLMLSYLVRFLRVPDRMLGVGFGEHQARKGRHSPSFQAGCSFDRNCMKFLLCGNSALASDSDLIRFRKLWVQVTRIKIMLYRHLVHDPAQSGLDAFDKRFKRLNLYLGSDISIEREVQAAKESESELMIETLELRKAPGEVSKLRKMHEQSPKPGVDRSRIQGKRNPAANGKRRDRPEMTWTLHFIRDKYGKHGLKAQIRGCVANARKLAAVFRQRPEWLESIRGLDVAGRELAGPLWVVAQPLEIVRKASQQACETHSGIRPLRITVHVGEDFRHLLSGLRTIHEPYWWKLMRRGDRIGHALALSWEPGDWCEDNPEILQPRHERMLDLAWMLDFVRERRMSDIDGAQIERAKSELQDHLDSWCGNGDYGFREFIAVARKLGCPRLWTTIDSLHWESTKFEGKYWRLLWEFFRRWDMNDDIIEVPTSHDKELLEALRDELAKLLAAWRTPIEINPSSNLLIGHLPYPLAQPMFHLDPFDRNEQRGLALTLSADDPTCFSTSLGDEFAYAWAGMVVGKGESPSYAHEWLVRAARTARRAAF